MKITALLFFLLLSTTTRSQSYRLEVNSGNHEQIISSYYDRETNQLIALDKLGFVVIWDLSNFSILNKFQLPPESAFGDTKKQAMGKYEVKAYDSVITILNPKNLYNSANGERLVDVYDRRTGAFKNQSRIGKISNLAFTKDHAQLAVVVTTTKSGYNELFTEGRIVKNYSESNSITETIDAVVSCLQLDEKKNRFAVGYENGRVEIRNLQTLKLIKSFNDFANDDEKNINQVEFIPGSDNVAFAAERSGKIIIRNGKTGAFVDSMELESITNYRIAVSPSGKYLSAITSGFYYLYLHDLEKKTTEKKLLHDSKNVLSLFLNEIFFINDKILSATGWGGVSGGINNFKVNGIGNAGAYMGLVELKTNNASVNLNISTANPWIESYGTRILKGSSLETIMFSTYSDEYIYTDPSKFILKTGNLADNKEAFAQYLNNRNIKNVRVSSLSRVGSNIAPDPTKPAIAGILFNKEAAFVGTDSFFVAFFNIAKDSFVGYSRLTLPANEAHYYSMLGVLSNRSLSFFNRTFKNAQGRKETRLFAFSGNGDKLLEDTLVNTYSNKTISISADGQYIAYQREPGTITVRSLKDFSITQTIKTGFKKIFGEDVSGYALPQFLAAKPGVLQHEAYKEANGYRIFCLLSTDINTKKTDTVIAINLRPVYYEPDSTGKMLTMLYNYDLSDSLLNDAAAVQRLMEQNLKPVFKPTVHLYDKEQKDFVNFIHTGTTGNSYASLRGNWITVLQNDGQLLYFNIKEKDKKITHLIDGNTQALVADSFYFASPGLVPLIKFKTLTQSFAAAQADVFLNRPHTVLQQLGSGSEFIKPYQLAFEKRLNQQNLTNQNFRSWLTANNPVSMGGVPQTFIETDKKDVILPLQFSAGKSSINRIYVQVNGQPVFGKKGLNIKKVIADGNLALELNANDNYITLVAEKEDGRQLEPVKYYYCYKPKNFKLPKLYFFSAGVSNYKDSTYNLKYAAKDAADIFEAFKYKSYDTIIYNILLDKEVTKQNINKWPKQIEGAGIEDVVIIYFAGHGLLDVKNNFYFAVYDMDFLKPEKNGLSYETILDLMDKSPSRKKILLLDACHSGAFDRSEPNQPVNAGTAGVGTIVNNEKRGVKINNSEKNVLSESQAFILMNQLFTDFSGDIGIDIIAASLGNSYALEMQTLKNGLFTYAMIRAVALSMAAPNGNETESITMAQVKEYVEKEVKRLSDGAQVPSIRSNNVQSNLINFFHSWKITADNSQQQFLEKYK